MTEDVKDIAEKKKGFVFRVDRFPLYVQSELQLVWRYFRNIAESSDKLGRIAEIEVDKLTTTGELTDGFYVNEDDFFAIYDALSKVRNEAKDLIDIDMNMLPSEKKRC